MACQLQALTHGGHADLNTGSITPRRRAHGPCVLDQQLLEPFVQVRLSDFLLFLVICVGGLELPTIGPPNVVEVRLQYL